MKKLYTFLLVVMFSQLGTKAMAQQNWSVGIGAGIFNNDLTRQMGLKGSNVFEDGNMFYLEVKRTFLAQKLYVSLSGIFNHTEDDYTITYPPFPTYHYQLFQYGAMLGLGYHWVQTRWITLSTGFDMGLNHYQFDTESDKEDKTRFIYHFNACRLRVGKQLGAYVQFGFGIKGIAGVGIDFRF